MRHPPIWLIPMIYTLASIVVGAVVPPLEYAYLPSYSHAASSGSAQAFFSAVSSGMMALTGIVFSIGFVVTQFTASAYSKRLTALFARDPLLYHALGLFIATFIFSLDALMWVDRGRTGRVPFVSSWVVITLLVLSMILLSLLVHRMSQLQVGVILRTVGDMGRYVIRSLAAIPADRGRSALDALRTEAGALATATPARRIRYSGVPLVVAGIDIAALVRYASGANVVIAVECASGDMLVQGTAILSIYGDGALPTDDELRGAVHLSEDRTFKQDARYPIRLLVDTAIMALSPAVNDPTTAVQALEQIEDLMQRLACCELRAGYVAGPSGELRVVFPTPSWDDFVSLAFTEIRQYGAGSVQVLRRLRATLLSLLDSVQDPERAASLERALAQLDRTVSLQPFDDDDRALALCSDREGLGLSWPPLASREKKPS